MSPTQRALKHLREMGYQAQVVEQNIRIPGKGMFKRDLFNCIDIVGVRAGVPVLGVQCTSHSNLSSRVKKCIENGQMWLAAGAQLEAWAFRKLKGHKDMQLDRRVIPLVDQQEAGSSRDCGSRLAPTKGARDEWPIL